MIRRRSKPLLVLAFAGVCTILIGAQVARYFQWRRVRGNVDELTAIALSSIRLVQRMGLDIERERILIDRHIFAHERDQMTELEIQIIEASGGRVSLESVAGRGTTVDVRLPIIVTAHRWR